MKPIWPNNKKFAFTIIDDTDMSTVDNVKPVYDLLNELGIKTTKTVWVYPPRDNVKGECLYDSHYKDFILKLRDYGFEIAFHGTGSGGFRREETLEAIEVFNKIIGYYPKLHVNHGNNPDGIYWGHKRFSYPFNILYKLLARNSIKFSGEDKDSMFFWGDICKQNIKYIRNRVFTGINTLRYDPYMPYEERGKEKYSNYWFSSSDGFDADIFCNLIRQENIERLYCEGGCCIVYTHFGYGFVDRNGRVVKQFKERVEYIAKKDGWFAPASEVLDYLQSQRKFDGYLSAFSSYKMDFNWFMERVYRKLYMKV